MTSRFVRQHCYSSEETEQKFCCSTFFHLFEDEGRTAILNWCHVRFFFCLAVEILIPFIECESLEECLCQVLLFILIRTCWEVHALGFCLSVRILARMLTVIRDLKCVDGEQTVWIGSSVVHGEHSAGDFAWQRRERHEVVALGVADFRSKRGIPPSSCSCALGHHVGPGAFSFALWKAKTGPKSWNATESGRQCGGQRSTQMISCWGGEGTQWSEFCG